MSLHYINACYVVDLQGLAETAPYDERHRFDAELRAGALPVEPIEHLAILVDLNWYQNSSSSDVVFQDRELFVRKRR